MTHPSLSAPFIPPPSLNPQEKMGRNERCWCGSELKWKKCHQNRHLEDEIIVGKLFSDIRHAQERGYCLHPNASNVNCTNPPIQAHTLQKRGGLAAIAEKGHVISVKKGFEKIYQSGMPVPSLVGIGNASTFLGFCSEHDNRLFEPIEKNNFVINDEAAFLMAYRAVSLEYMVKKNSLEIIKYQKRMDQGKPFWMQIQVQEMACLYEHGMRQGVLDLEFLKMQYDQKLLLSDFSGIKYYGVNFDGVLPVVACGGFAPEVSFDGRQIQILTRGTGDLESLFLTISVLNGKTYLLFSWIGPAGGVCEDFVNSFRTIPNLEKANMCLHLAIEHVENTFFSPNWWEGILEEDKENLLSRMKSGIGTEGRTKHAFQAVKSILPSYAVLQEFSSGV